MEQQRLKETLARICRQKKSKGSVSPNSAFANNNFHNNVQLLFPHHLEVSQVITDEDNDEMENHSDEDPMSIKSFFFDSLEVLFGMKRKLSNYHVPSELPLYTHQYINESTTLPILHTYYMEYSRSIYLRSSSSFSQ